MISRLTDRIETGGWRGGLILIVLVVGAYYLGSSRQVVSVHTGVPSSALYAISVEVDGWTYSIPLDGVEWIDAAGSLHDGQRPDCLPVDGTTRPVMFGSVDVSKDGANWRAVVWVDCR